MVGTRPAKTRSDATVGQLLHRARAARKLSLKEVSKELNIPVRHLESLEQGDLSTFTAEVYARGAFQQYADFLQVRAEKTQHAFLRVLSGAREYVPLRVHRPLPWLQRFITPRWILAGAIALIAVLVGSYIGWQVQTFLRLPDLALLEPTSEVISGATVTIRGRAESNAQVTVNGETTVLANDGVFEVPMYLHPGINVLQIEAKNAAGRTRTITRDLLMPRQ